MRVTAGRAAGSTWVGVTGCRLSRWRLAATAAVAVLVGVAAWAGTARAALPSNCSETGGTVTCTFSETGGSQSWTVPSGLASATFVVDGAAGSPSADDLTPSGLGGQVSATMGSLTAGQVFTIEVGGAGSVNGPGGFNGGGSAGADGGAGGGFSSVSLGSTVELVAGGGGGGGMVGFSFETCGFSNVAGGPGGAGGQVGVDGTGGGSTSCSTETLGPGGGGNAGGDTVNPGAGGAAGAASGTPINDGCGESPFDFNGFQGSSSSGSTGGAGQEGGGGGGGGDVGGGGGGSGAFDVCGAGGGQGGGGGGSSHAAVSGAAFSTGVQSGNGRVTISYAAPTASITTPANGASYAFGQQVTSGFTCADVLGGPGIASCVDQNGNPSGSAVDTSALGSHAFTVTATNANGLVGQGSVTYTVTKASQSIAFTSSPPSPAVFGGGYTPAATGGASGNPVVFSVDSSSGAGVCSISSGTVSFTGAGTCVIDANQAGDADYDPAAQQQQSFTVGKASQVVAFTSSPPAPAVFGGGYTPSATGGGSGNPVVFSVDSSSGAGVCSISSGTVSFTGAGTCVIDANQAGDADYDPAAQQQQSFTVGKASQVVAFTSTPPSPAVLGGNYTPAATGGASGNPVVFSVDSSSGAGVCSISSGTVSFTGAGTCVIDANQAGNANYDPAAQQQQSFTVGKASQVVAFTSTPPSPAVLGGSYKPAATGGASGNPVVFSVDSSSGAGVCSISSGTVSFIGAGTCVIDANQAGNANYDPAAQQRQSFTVVKSPSVQINSPADGQTFALGQHVVTSFSCAEGTDGPGLSACTDASGAQAPSGVLDTSRLGTFSYNVIATSKDGQTETASITYTVAAAPTASISSPASGAVYALGQAVVVNYSCQDGASGPGIRSCAGTLPNGSSLDTSTPGRHSFTVTATSQDGQSTTTTVGYGVTLPSNRLVDRPRPKPHSDGTFIVTVKVPGPGRVDILVTAWNDNVAHISLLQPAAGRFAFARAHATSSTAKTIQIVVRPNAKGRRLVNRHRYQVTLRLWVTYTPAGGKSRSIGYYGLHLP